MIALLSDLGLAITLFASTNLDDLFVLIGVFSDSRHRPRQIAVGQILGLAALVLASLAGALLSPVVPPAWLGLFGLMGLVPIALGLFRLLALRPDDADDAPGEPAALGTVLAVAAVTVANGGDNIGIDTPVFATSSTPRLVVMIAVFAAMVALWLGLAHWLVHHPALGAPIRRIGRVATPFVLIGFGAMVLAEAGTLVAGRWSLVAGRWSLVAGRAAMNGIRDNPNHFAAESCKLVNKSLMMSLIKIRRNRPSLRLLDISVCNAAP